jgi:predicted 3-demethylubiquinone-9 3-methyltransferase (glyoxalase superfamily)
MTTATPFLMFQGGVAQAAMDLYIAAFPDSRIVRAVRYTKGEPGRSAPSRHPTTAL